MPGKSGKDWCGDSRQEQVDTGKRFIEGMTTKIKDKDGKQVTVKEFLGYPDDEMGILTGTWDKAQGALEMAKIHGRSDEITAELNATFPPYIKQLRHTRNGWVNDDKTTPAIRAIFGIKEKDKNPDSGGEPTGVVAVEVAKRGQGLLVFRMIWNEGDPKDKSNKVLRLFMKVLAPGEAPPESPKELMDSGKANRGLEKREFDYLDSGKQVAVAVRVENGKLKGRFGPIGIFTIP